MPELAEGDIQQKGAEDKEMEGEVVQDMNGDVHMKLSVPLVSCENRGAARVCNCAVFTEGKAQSFKKCK